ncbi:MAG TPA: DUF2723 domain-containing protein [Polyangiaceae bacterium]|nr:DUF2723 domain-containing protein [Polyangiaceae bacterium]
MSISRRSWVVIAALALAVYLATACPYVVGGDNGEFATLSVTGGVAHPPGFPSYVLALRLSSILPASSPAHAAALVTALFGALAVLGVGWAATVAGASDWASGVAAAAFASSAVLWKLATHAEAFAPAAFLGAVIVGLSLRPPGKHGAGELGLLGLVAGLGLSTHTTLVLLLPIGLHGARRILRAAESKARALVAGLAGLALGLTPYLHLWYSARTSDPIAAWVWGDLHDAADVVRHFLRSEYGSTRLGAADRAPLSGENLRRFAVASLRDLLGLPIVALAGVAVLPFRNDGPSRRNDVLALFLAFVTTGPLFVALFNRPMTDVGPLIVERFYLLPFVVLSVLAALGLDAGASRPPHPVVARLAPIAALSAGLFLSAGRVREYGRPTLENYVSNVLSYLPERTVVLGHGDDKFGGYLYARYALGARPDVAYVSPVLLFSDWYRAREGRRLGVDLPKPDGGTLHVAEIVDRLLSAGHPVAFAGYVAQGLDRTFPTYPLGPVLMVVPRGGTVPSPDVLLAMNDALLSRFSLEDPPPDSREGWAYLLQADYATPYLALATAFAAAGRPTEAARCRARAAALAPAPR